MTSAPRGRGRPAPAALDVNALLALRAPAYDEPTLLERIEAHLEEHEGYVAFSGGKDSAVVLDLARRVDPAVHVVWHDSGLEFPETRTYIAELAEQWSLNLHIEQATPSLLELLRDSAVLDLERPTGRLPDLQRLVVQEPARRAHTLFGPGELWGVRSQESDGRRIGYAKAVRLEVEQHCHGCCAPTVGAPSAQQRARHGGVIRRGDGTVAYGPIWDWTTAQTLTYHHCRAIPANPLYAKLAALGVPEREQRVNAILDLSRLERGRVTWLQRGWPALFNALAEAMPRLRDYT